MPPAFNQQTYSRGVGKMLKELTAAKIPLRIATKKRQRLTVQILDVLGWSALFDQVLCPDSFIPHLPCKAAILAKLLAQSKLAVKDDLHVSDRLDDYKAAKRIGIPFALAEWGFEEEDIDFTADTIRLQRPDADHLVIHFIDRANR